jgi:hypothetical protein
MWYCNHCKAPVTAEANQCGRCGAYIMPAMVAFPPHLFPHLYGIPSINQATLPQPQYFNVMPPQREGFLHGLGRLIWALIMLAFLLPLALVLFNMP